jgi:tetratricopeptide (TPR) repeat protein
MAYYFLGNVYTDRWQPGDVDLAMQEYDRVWAIAPNYVQSHHQAGLVFLKKGQDDRHKADDFLHQGKMAEAQMALSAAQKDWEQAIVFFKKYHGLDPVFQPNYARMGWVHMQLAEIAKMRDDAAGMERHYDAAEAAYKESLGAWVCGIPENNVLHENWSRNHRHFEADMFENLANTRFVRGHLSEAKKAYEMSLWIDPKNVRVIKNLAALYARLGQQRDVYRLWDRVRQLAPQDPDAQRVFHANVQTHP